jgi:DNA-binding CsgD family transcriptional regulator
MGREVLTLACPDWREASFAVDAENGEIAYANWQALALLDDARAPISIFGDRLIFTDPGHNQQYFIGLEKLRTSLAEEEVFVIAGNSEADWFAVTIHNPQGLYREILKRSLQAAGILSEIIFVEIGRTKKAPSASQIAAFSDAFKFTPAEAELVFSLAQGQTLEDVAGRRNAAISTVRQRLKTVLAKSGCRRQADLVRHIVSLC